MELIAKILEVINNKISLPIAIFCAVLLLLPKSLTEQISISYFIKTNKDTIWLFFLFSTILYSYEKTKVIISYFQNKINLVKEKSISQKGLSDCLDSLSHEEKSWLYYCLRENLNTVIATSINPIAISLESKKLVHRPITPHDITATPFTLNKKVWDHLKNNKDVFCPNDVQEDKSYNREIDEFIRRLRSVV